MRTTNGRAAVLCSPNFSPPKPNETERKRPKSPDWVARATRPQYPATRRIHPSCPPQIKKNANTRVYPCLSEFIRVYVSLSEFTWVYPRHTLKHASARAGNKKNPNKRA